MTKIDAVIPNIKSKELNSKRRVKKLKEKFVRIMGIFNKKYVYPMFNYTGDYDQPDIHLEYWTLKILDDLVKESVARVSHRKKIVEISDENGRHLGTVVIDSLDMNVTEFRALILSQNISLRDKVFSFNKRGTNNIYQSEDKTTIFQISTGKGKGIYTVKINLNPYALNTEDKLIE